MKVLEEELVELRDDQGRMRMLMAQLVRHAETAKAKVADVSDQLASVRT